MEDERWNSILAKINAPRSVWRPLASDLHEAKKAFSSGKGIGWSDLQKLRKTWRSDYPFVDSDGRAFVLYIYDQAGNNYRPNWGRYSRSSSSPREYKFHFCWCQALETMSAIGRSARYKAKQDVDNDIFTVNRGAQTDEKIRMNVCRFCLGKMGYQGYSHESPSPEKDRIYGAFQIGQFFIENAPMSLTRPTHPHHTGRYPAEWPQISRRIKEERGNRCEDGSSHPGPFHVHHINGVKDDCRPSNLKVLCYDCHARQPLHQHMSRSGFSRK